MNPLYMLHRNKYNLAIDLLEKGISNWISIVDYYSPVDTETTLHFLNK